MTVQTQTSFEMENCMSRARNDQNRNSCRIGLGTVKTRKMHYKFQHFPSWNFRVLMRVRIQSCVQFYFRVYGSASL